MSIDWAHYAPAVLAAVGVTLQFTVLGFVGAVVIGLVIALMRVSPLKPARVLARIYTEVFRNLPLITEIYIIYFGLASIGIRFSAVQAGAISLSIFYGAYLSEIFRAGIEGVPRGQWEAGEAVGLTRAGVLRHVTLPQAIRLALPGTSTMLVDLLKGTSLMVTIGGAELMTQAGIIVSDTFRALEVYLVIGAIYVALAYPLSQLSVALEARLKTAKPLLPGRRGLLAAARRARRSPPQPAAASPAAARRDESVPVVSIRSLSKRFGDREALSGIDLDVRPGEVVSIVGRSGSGKSTLLRCLDLLEIPSAGQITVEGEVIYYNGVRLERGELVKLRQRLGMVFQSLNLFPHLTAVENVTLPQVQGVGMKRDEALDRALFFLDRVGLADRAFDLPATLSGGQQQRVAIARALALSPTALLFDEPTSALDPESAGEVLEVMAELSKAGTTMLVVTHELGFAAEASSRIVFMDSGRIAEIGPPADIIHRPSHPRTRAFMETYLKRGARMRAEARI